MNPKNLIISVHPGGFGKLLTEAALKRGDHVIAITQDIGALQGLAEKYQDALYRIPLNLADRKSAFDGIEKALEIFGRINAAVDAGFNLVNDHPKTPKPEWKALLENELLGTPWFAQAVFPIIKQQNSGHFIQVSSTSRLILPALGHFPVPKPGEISFLERLADEIQKQGVQVSFIEPFTNENQLRHSTVELYVKERCISYSRFRINYGDASSIANLMLGIIDKEQQASSSNNQTITSA